MTQLSEEQHRRTKKPPERLWLIPTTTGWLHEFDTPYAGDDGFEYVRKRVNTPEALAQIRQRQGERRARCELTVKGTDIPLPQSIPNIDFLLSLYEQQLAENERLNAIVSAYENQDEEALTEAYEL